MNKVENPLIADVVREHQDTDTKEEMKPAERGTLWAKIVNMVQEIQNGPNKVITDEQMATALARRDPELRRPGQSWTDFVREVRKILKHHKFFSGQVESGNGAAMSMYAPAIPISQERAHQVAFQLMNGSPARGNGDARHQQIVSAMFGAEPGTAGTAPTTAPTDFTHVFRGDPSWPAKHPPQGDAPAQMDEEEVKALKKLVKRARRVLEYLPWKSRQKAFLSGEIIDMSKYADMQRRPPQSCIKAFAGLVARCEAEVGNAAELMPAVRP